MSDELLSNTLSNRQEYFRENRALLEELARSGQSPTAFFIGCSDSRILPERLLAIRPGEYFMHRNIANALPPYWQTEIGIVAILEFAILKLTVPHLIICGHTDCGGILALDESIDMSKHPAMARWLDLIQPARRQVDAANQDLAGDVRHQMIVERNVVNQLENARTYPFVQQAISEGKLSLHGWVYYLEEQEIRFFDAQKNSFVLP